MRFIDFFSGVGGFTRGMQLAGHECVGHCEIDRYAEISYRSMHLITDEQRSYLLQLPLKERQKEILKEKYLNGEWYANDIDRLYYGDIPDADCWCFGFPCQDISIAGKQAGFKGNRSSLFFRVMYLIGRLQEEKKPEWLFIENVKNLLSVNRGWDYARLLSELDKAGYDAEWQILNSKNFGVPQNRERCFIIGHLRSRGGRQVLPITGSDTETADIQKNKLIIDDTYASREPRVYSENSPTIRAGHTFKVAQVGQIYGTEREPNPQAGRVYDSKGISPCLDTCSGGNRMPKILEPIEGIRIRKLTPKECFRLQGWSDDYFDKARFVNSDSQLYKQAGNGVTVNVIYEIAKRLRVEVSS